ncbi:thioester reductase domain-containing protein [Micromonospora sp. NPDC048871]|uniref:thioester reductase domain-containing protein n=1 Tax=unclassified Micromonospora TaxID=2617518 RepID=UPI002E146750|nr:thioester reductase domain-containing protein [Micromonospora sp. NBC_01739]
MSSTDIAIVAVGCRFPDATTPETFWRNLDSGLVSTRPLDEETLRTAGVSDDTLRDPAFVRVAATLPEAADFASEFFNYPPAEAELIDPQQRLFLEACWEALESAGHPARPDGPVTGVFAGGASSTYSSAVFAAKVRESGLAAAVDDMGLHLGGLGDFLSSRVAYKLGLRGPSVGVQTACSSSLYALHYAVLSLLSGECDIALAGGATVLEPVMGYRYQAGGLMSEDGFCRAFDSRATGTSFSSGVGVVVLRRLTDALADGDNVLAVVRGSAVGNDGSARSGFTAPSPSGVADVVSGALRVADASGRDLRYVEAHGSGTALGDQIELRGLSDGLRHYGADTGYCGLGSVKVNIGHPGPAAGIAGLIKAVHVVRTGNLPPHPLFRHPRHPGMLAESPFFVSTESGHTADPARLVLVNSMGLGGTNAAVVLAPPPAPVRPSAPLRPTITLMLSARNRGELDAMSRNLADRLEQGELPPADVAHTLRVGRHDFDVRRAVVAPPERLAATLRLPRPPAARTVTSTERAVTVVAGDSSNAVVERLRRVFGADCEVADRVPEVVPPGRFLIQVGAGEAGTDRFVLPADADDVQIEAAVTAAWLHGVRVDWEPLSRGTGRRVALPTYPFTRRRHWILDRYPSAAEASAPATGPAPALPAGTGSGEVEDELLAIWRDLFGVEGIGVDHEFGALGGSSLLSVQMALEVQRRLGVLVNLHRAGGSRATIRRIGEIVRGVRAGAARGADDIDPIADGDGELIDLDLQLPLGEVNPRPAAGTDVLLTGATGFLGTFLLHELLKASAGRVYCIVRAEDEDQAWARLDAAATSLLLPAPDRSRVHLVLGDLSDVGTLCETYRNGELARRVGTVVHCAAKVVFTEPYRVLRTDNVLTMVELLRWMRRHGIADFGFVSTVAATHHALGADGRILETREQPLDPQQGGYGVGKWVCERILERSETDGMRVRIFRPGFILGSTETGACNHKDLVWHIAASGLAVGAHPMDDRAMPMAPVDLVSRAIAELSLDPGSAGRVYHLTDEVAVSPQRLFALLTEVGLPTTAVTPEEWQRRVADRSLATGNELLATMALYELEGHALGERDLEAVAWRRWLAARGLDPAPTGDLLRRCLTFLARTTTKFGELIAEDLESAQKIEVGAP